VLVKNLKKIDLVKNINKKTGLSSSFIKKIIDDLLEIISKNISSGNFNLKNIGTFKLLNKKERLGRNPKTNEEFIIYPRKSISFTPSKKISKKLN
tara:strand:- start:302 stop:586 length:285 start_codon:yes stop_codon:yes gene_type:complete